MNDDIASEREIYWIEYYGSFKNGYNATMGGDGKRYADYDLIVSLYNEGKTNKEICEITKYSEKTVTMALNQANITSLDRRIRSHGGMSVLMLDKNTDEIINIFSSITQAENYLNKPSSRRHITEVCKGKRKTAYGYKWKYGNK